MCGSEFCGKKDMNSGEDQELSYAIEEAFTGDFKSLKERFPLLPSKLGDPPKLSELMDIRKELFRQFQDEVIKRLL